MARGLSVGRERRNMGDGVATSNTVLENDWGDRH